MSDRLEELLRSAARTAPEAAEPRNLDKITALLSESLTPVRPLPAVGWHVALLLLVCAGVACAGAAALGMGGLHKLSTWAALVILVALTILGTGVAYSTANAMRPGTRRLISAGTLVGAVSASTAVLFALIFVHYGFFHFFAHGLACLKAGVINAAIAAALMWFVLRRTYAVDPKAAGTIIGTLAGFAGVAMLELHCTDFHAQHVLVWHTAVLPCSALLGRLLAGAIARYLP
jgi:hypothetical protein